MFFFKKIGKKNLVIIINVMVVISLQEVIVILILKLELFIFIICLVEILEVMSDLFIVYQGSVLFVKK